MIFAKMKELDFSVKQNRIALRSSISLLSPVQLNDSLKALSKTLNERLRLLDKALNKQSGKYDLYKHSKFYQRALDRLELHDISVDTVKSGMFAGKVKFRTVFRGLSRETKENLLYDYIELLSMKTSSVRGTRSYMDKSKVAQKIAYRREAMQLGRTEEQIRKHDEMIDRLDPEDLQDIWEALKRHDLVDVYGSDAVNDNIEQFAELNVGKYEELLYAVDKERHENGDMPLEELLDFMKEQYATAMINY